MSIRRTEWITVARMKVAQIISSYTVHIFVITESVEFIDAVLSWRGKSPFRGSKSDIVIPLSRFDYSSRMFLEAILIIIAVWSQIYWRFVLWRKDVLKDNSFGQRYGSFFNRFDFKAIYWERFSPWTCKCTINVLTWTIVWLFEKCRLGENSIGIHPVQISRINITTRKGQKGKERKFFLAVAKIFP